MKLMKICSVVMVAVLMFTLTGCGDKPENKKEEAVPAKVDIEFYQEGEDADDDRWLMYTDEEYEGSEYLVPVSVKTDREISDVRFLSVEMGKVSDNETEFFVNREICKVDKLTPEKTLLLKTEFPNFEPGLALEYKDATGDVKVFSIAMSGKDSSIVVEKAVLSDKKAPEESANVVMNFAEKGEAEEYSAYSSFTDTVYTNEEYQQAVIIKTDIKITDVKILDATLVNGEGDAAEFSVNSVLYEQDELEGSNPLIYKTEFPGDMPDRLISYKDADGKEKVYSLSISGKDGSLVASPAVIAE